MCAQVVKRKKKMSWSDKNEPEICGNPVERSWRNEGADDTGCLTLYQWNLICIRVHPTLSYYLYIVILCIKRSYRDIMREYLALYAICSYLYSLKSNYILCSVHLFSIPSYCYRWLFVIVGCLGAVYLITWSQLPNVYVYTWLFVCFRKKKKVA